MHLPTTNPISALTTDESSFSAKTKAILAASSLTLLAAAALHRLYLCFKVRQAARRAHLASTYPSDDKSRLFLDQDEIESDFNTTTTTMNAGVPPFTWQAGAGLLPNPESQTLPAYYPMGNGVGGYIPGGMAGMMPYNMSGGAMGFGGGGGGGFGGGMNPAGPGQPKPQFLPPGPMPTGGGYGGGMMGMGMGMMPYGGCGPMAGDMGMMMGGMPGGGALPPLHVPGPPGMTQTFPKGFTTFHLVRACGSARRQFALLESLLNQPGMSFDFETWQVPCTDYVGEFLKNIKGDKDRYRLTEIRETGDGTWEQAQHVKWSDEPGRFRRLESIGWGGKAGTGNGRVVWCVLWKKPNRN